MIYGITEGDVSSATNTVRWFMDTFPTPEVALVGSAILGIVAALVYFGKKYWRWFQ